MGTCGRDVLWAEEGIMQRQNRKLQRQYFTWKADAQLWDAPWRSAPDRIMPSTDAGSAPQESWRCDGEDREDLRGGLWGWGWERGGGGGSPAHPQRHTLLLFCFFLEALIPVFGLESNVF